MKKCVNIQNDNSEYWNYKNCDEYKPVLLTSKAGIINSKTNTPGLSPALI